MTDKWFRVVRITGQGYGIMTPETWDAIPAAFHERVRVLELIQDKCSATARCQQLMRAIGDSEWKDKPGLHKAHGQWWEDSGLVLGGMQLQMPADAPLPMVEVEIPPELYILAGILGRLPPERTRAETRALDWCATQPQILAPR